MMFYPNQPILNDEVYIVHCKHKECNDESYAFNDLYYATKWVDKHDDAFNGLDAVDNDPHGEVDVYIYKRVRKLTYEQSKGYDKL